MEMVTYRAYVLKSKFYSSQFLLDTHRFHAKANSNYQQCQYKVRAQEHRIATGHEEILAFLLLGD